VTRPKKFLVLVTQVVEVKINPAKFDKKFMREFREMMYPFHTHADHAMHLGQLAARGMMNGTSVEGYGEFSDMGIEVRIKNQDQEIVK
jgi:hypothetical protein